ncbi:hypothetical protein Pint_11512 [Pistacia integerrima]|uniref:Uncharacterized protein n=1 Tax=Pistacia integerrima TaxID=434235 RepID=A0ACC0XHX4_9ROSI|nr:hypothetical protein Pint_11512 [Pistacia integerrima]
MNFKLKPLPSSSSSSSFAHLFCICFIVFFILQESTAQTATTDPIEERIYKILCHLVRSAGVGSCVSGVTDWMGRLRRVGRGVVARTVCYDWKVGGMGGSTTAEGGGNGWECGCWRSMGHNGFSGSLPKELGNLKELNFL